MLKSLIIFPFFAVLFFVGFPVDSLTEISQEQEQQIESADSQRIAGSFEYVMPYSSVSNVCAQDGWISEVKCELELFQKAAEEDRVNMLLQEPVNELDSPISQ